MPIALIFSIFQWLMIFYINCASHAPGVKFGHALGVDNLHRLTMGKTKKKSSLKPEGPELLYFVCSNAW